jgi:Mrp family chromosome partitioning ATPase
VKKERKNERKDTILVSVERMFSGIPPPSTSIYTTHHIAH